MLGLAVAPGDEVSVELTPEGPQRADLAEDIAAALAANPAAGAFFDTLAQFYRRPISAGSCDYPPPGGPRRPHRRGRGPPRGRVKERPR